MNKFKKYGVYFAVGTMLFGLFGCGEKSKADELKKDIANQQNLIASENAADKNKNTIVKENINRTSGTIGKIVDEIEGSGYRIKIDADVFDETTSALSTYTMNKAEYSDEEIVRIAEKLFDNGKYEVIKPLELSNMDELKKTKEYFEKLRVDYELDKLNYEMKDQQKFDTYVIKMIDMIDIYMKEYTGANISDAGGPIYTLEDTPSLFLYCQPNYIFRKYINGQRALFTGKVNGKPWILLYQDIESFRKAESTFTRTDDKEPTEIIFEELVAIDLTNNCISGYNCYVGEDNIINGTSETNSCDIGSVDAVNRFYEIFGLDSYDTVEVRDLMRIQENGNANCEGYGVSFQPKIDGTKPIVWQMNPKPTEYAGSYYGYASINENGVEYFTVRDRYTWTVKEESPKLMDFETLNGKAMDYLKQSSMKNYVANCFADSNKYVKEPTIHSIKLKNVVYKSDSGEIVSAPSWVYYWKLVDENKSDIITRAISLFDDSRIAFAVDATNGTIIRADGENTNAISYGFNANQMIFSGAGFTE